MSDIPYPYRIEVQGLDNGEVKITITRMEDNYQSYITLAPEAAKKFGRIVVRVANKVRIH